MVLLKKYRVIHQHPSSLSSKTLKYDVDMSVMVVYFYFKDLKVDTQVSNGTIYHQYIERRNERFGLNRSMFQNYMSRSYRNPQRKQGLEGRLDL